MAAVLLRPHDLDAAHDAPAGLVLVEQERGDALALVVGGARREDEMRGAVGAGDEPLAAVDFPCVAVLLGIGLDHARIGAAAGRGLGHGEGRADLALDDRLQPLLLLRRRAELLQHVHVAVVGRHAVERERPEQRARRLLVHHRPGDDRQVHAAVFLGRLRRPQAGLLRLLAHRLEPLLGDVLVLGEILRVGFERQHVLLDEGAHAHAQVLDLGRQGEVHAVACCCNEWGLAGAYCHLRASAGRGIAGANGAVRLARTPVPNQRTALALQYDKRLAAVQDRSANTSSASSNVLPGASSQFPSLR